ncbi:phosphotransferase [Thalassomonas sp. M1454]|uniref:phosphotransferase n=1 Tax=Thalassomonas sp. M1454 TaxID=2594477 RepID=UPI00117D3374|nr:phosphotransferase [Thalassomonas sp. M1454]TRX56813.1 phosphotransferase [Thalassomonas sp. M1454]
MTVIEQLHAIDVLQPISSWQEINTGLSHHCFKVVSKAQTFFVKIYNKPNLSSFDTQISVEKLASAQSIGPKVISYCPHGHYCVYQYLDGVILDDVSITIEAKHKHLIDLLSACHSLPKSAQALDISLSVDNLLAKVDLPYAAKNNISDSVSDILKSINVSANELVLCHGDINYTNVMVVDNILKLIDWEYCCLAECEYDIAMALTINNIAESNYPEFVALYNDKSKHAQASLKKVVSYAKLCNLLNSLWYVANHKTSNPTLNKQYFQAKAFIHTFA